ncbi:hypothetical protein HanRHA438_Chr06g0274781 [Helianthus annuus]|uniref:Uncharacterized protein n=1 Tax=Helianthus annuus TaxID=4232 RepID=A0A9K3ITS3_HELAN|nr:hypothetical protein HanXRQr2_Chr06g0265711 [Helianthus annuus]KAJ0912477.1 hypothetical protein HanRHA438_Chr06g0274781 [Helianthus annuus]
MRKMVRNQYLAQEETSLAQPCVSLGAIQMLVSQGRNLVPGGRNLALTADSHAKIQDFTLF